MGAPFETLPKSGDIDEKGLASFTVEFHGDTLAEVMLAMEPTWMGLLLTKRSFATDPAGHWMGTGVYEGVIEDSSLPEEVGEEWELDDSYREKPLQSHPDWERIKAVFKAQVDENGEISFPEYISASKSAPLSAQKKAPRKNPFFGAKTYPVTGPVARRTRVVTTVPRSLLNAHNKILDRLPIDDLQGLEIPEGSKWFVMPPKAARRGSAIEITEEFRMLPPEGFENELLALANGESIFTNPTTTPTLAA